MSLENEPKPSMADIVESEIQSQPGQNEFARIKRVTNNFVHRLPRSDGKSVDALTAEAFGKPLDPSKRYLDECVMRDETEETVIAELRKDGYSDKRIFGTHSQFDEDVRTAIRESGIDAVAFARLMDQYDPQKMRLIQIFNNAEIFREFILPIYIKLREMGYTLRDLY